MKHRKHDDFCYVAQSGGSCCPWMGNCDCMCSCDSIDAIREDERRKMLSEFSGKKSKRHKQEVMDAYVLGLQTCADEIINIAADIADGWSISTHDFVSKFPHTSWRELKRRLRNND